jgi:hypothetical protein
MAFVRALAAVVVLSSFAAWAQAPAAAELPLHRCWDYGSTTRVDPTVELDVSHRAHVTVSGSGGSVHGASSPGSGSAPAPSGTHGATPVGGGGSSSGSSGGGGSLNLGGGGGGNAEGLLIAAVVVVAALPIVVYALDSDPEAEVRERFFCPSFSVEGTAGTQGGLGVASQLLTSTRLGFGFSYLATDLEYAWSDGGPSALGAHFILRAEPRTHVSGGLALGYRRQAWDGVERGGFELGLPHTYAFTRDGLRTIGLELRPMLAFTRDGIDARLEAAFLFPLADFLHIRAGGRVFSFGATTFFGLDAGLSLTL